MIERLPSAQSEPRELPNFTGQLTLDPLLQSPALRVSRVAFRAGSRTHWHTHDGEQLLLVTEGSGRVATRDDSLLLAAGDIALISGGTEHWHGSVSEAFCHVAVTTGGTHWLEAVSTEDLARTGAVVMMKADR